MVNICIDIAYYNVLHVYYKKWQSSVLYLDKSTPTLKCFCSIYYDGSWYMYMFSLITEKNSALDTFSVCVLDCHDIWFMFSYFFSYF